VHELDARGLVSKERLAAEVERAAQQAVERAVQKAGGHERSPRGRADLVMLRNLAHLLREPTPRSAGPLQVIEGGRAEEQHEKPGGGGGRDG
jgi:hypothetical protein